jgi:ribosomal protein S18 acetylase RimI-like enzyme
MSLFYKLKDVESSDFQAAIEIYEEAFPDRERVANSLVAERIKNHTDQLFVSQAENRIVFMAILCEPILEDFVLLGYIATHPGFHNRGIGSDFFVYVLEFLKKESKYLLLEVEDPKSGLD